MTVKAGLLLLAGIAALIVGFRYIWNSIPVFQCPQCFSYNINPSEEPLNDITVMQCNDCGHEWRDE